MANISNKIVKENLVPLVFGITGHRDIRDEDKEILKDIVKNYFRKFAKDYPETPILLLSPLAEGADRLVALSFLELRREDEFFQDKNKFKLVVPLPMAKDEYLKDFMDEYSTKEFNELLDQAELFFELPIVNNNVQSFINDNDFRKKQYAQLGAYIVQNCQVLIALWDGIENNLEGGTACTVRYHCNGIPGEYKRKHNPFNTVETGPVYHIITPRKSNTLIPDKIFTEKYIYPDFWSNNHKDKNNEQVESIAKEFYDNIFQMFNTLNKDLANINIHLKEFPESSKKYLINSENTGIVNSNLERVADYFSVFDLLAIKFRNKRELVLRVSLTLIVFAVLCFQIFLEFVNHPIVLMLYPLSLIAGLLIFLFAKSKQFDKKHEDYRSIAEGLRVHFHWSFNDIHENINDYLLNKHKGELEWIRQCVSNIQLITNTINRNNDDVLQSKLKENQWTLEHWIKKQASYFYIKSNYNYIKENKYKKLSSVSYILGLICALSLLSLKLFSNSTDTILTIPESFFHHIFVVLIGFSLAILGTSKSYVEKMSFSELSQQYSMMSNIYQRAGNEIGKNIDCYNQEKINKTIIYLGKEALCENTDWLLVHRSHSLELPSG
ncbi:MAG: hypothetical protein ACOYN6_15245 [Ignavibacteria bacterium]